jgi:hypothetical protein
MNYGSEILFELIIASLAAVAMAYLLWQKTKCVGFPLAIAAVYFWTIHGGWGVYAYLQTGSRDATWTYLLDKMFPVDLDYCYAFALFVYLLFLMAFGATTYFVVTPNTLPDRKPILKINHVRLLAVATFFAILALYFSSEIISVAINSGQPAYIVIGSGYSSGLKYSLLQLCLRAALLPAVLGFTTWCTDTGNNFLVGTKSYWSGHAYLVLLLSLTLLCAFLGNKNALLQVLITGICCYEGNSMKPQFLRLCLLFLGILTLIAYINVLRGRGIESLFKEFSFRELLLAIQHAVESHEQYAAHLSMYGIIRFDIPMTFGWSFVSLFASIIPRAFWPSRPEPSYAYYAQELGLATGQGYTIHHATGWYINFGILGVLLGGSILGFIWGKSFKLSRNPNPTTSHLMNVFVATSFYLVTGGIPRLLRSGPEGYKSFLLTCVIFPITILFFTTKSIPNYQTKQRRISDTET